MKKMRVEHNCLIGYIQYQDLELLIKMKELVRPEFFKEPSILKGECDEDGYYRITDLRNVNFVKSLKCIPNYDYLLKLAENEICSMEENAIGEYNAVSYILERLCNTPSIITEQEIDILSNSSIIEPKLVAAFFEASKLPNKDERYRYLALCMKEQLTHYCNAISYMAQLKRQEQVEKKGFSLKRIFPKSTKKQG